MLLWLFLSTPSARRATCCGRLRALLQVISIHALREEGDLRDSVIFVRFAEISIHALREEGDRTRWPSSILLMISIHALREEGDNGSKVRRFD